MNIEDDKVMKEISCDSANIVGMRVTAYFGKEIFNQPETTLGHLLRMILNRKHRLFY